MISQYSIFNISIYNLKSETCTIMAMKIQSWLPSAYSDHKDAANLNNLLLSPILLTFNPYFVTSNN